MFDDFFSNKFYAIATIQTAGLTLPNRYLSLIRWHVNSANLGSVPAAAMEFGLTRFAQK